MRLADQLTRKARKMNLDLINKVTYNKGAKINFIGTSGSGATTMALATEYNLRNSGKCLLVDTDGRHDGLGAYLKVYTMEYAGIGSILDKLQAGVEWKTHIGKSIASVRCPHLSLTKGMHEAVLNTTNREDLGRFIKDLLDIYIIKYNYVISDSGFLSTPSKLDLTSKVTLNVIVCETSKKSLDILNQYRSKVRQKVQHELQSNTLVVLNKVTDNHNFVVASENLVAAGWDVLDGPIKLSRTIADSDSIGSNFMYHRESTAKMIGKDNPFKEVGQIAQYILDQVT